MLDDVLVVVVKAMAIIVIGVVVVVPNDNNDVVARMTGHSNRDSGRTITETERMMQCMVVVYYCAILVGPREGKKSSSSNEMHCFHFFKENRFYFFRYL